MADIFEIYEEKIIRILENKLGFYEDNWKAVLDIKTWLCCEWQCSEMSMEEYAELKNLAEMIAKRMIKEL